MEWNWNGNWNVIPSLQLESSGDSEELLKPHVHNHQQQKEEEKEENQEVVDMDGCHHGHDDDDGDGDGDGDDDAQSCSYDHPSYANTRTYGNRNYQDDIQTTPRGFMYDDDDDGDGEVDDGKMKKVMDPCISNQFCHQFCGDSCSHEREVDRKFWETCLAS